MLKFRIACLFIFTAVSALAQGDAIQWPDGQLLPVFGKPAETVECIELSQASDAEADLFTSLEGLVNRAQPRLACLAERNGEGMFTWIKIHKLPYHIVDGYAEILKYRTNVTGLVVTDPNQPDTLNLATTIAGVKNELICDPELIATLTNAPYQIPIVDDLRGKFSDKYEVYEYLHSNYWSRCTHRIFAGMGTTLHGNLRDYLVALKVATVWLGPGKDRDADLLRSFVADMKPVEGVYMGWWPGEGDGLEWIGHYGIPVLASDFFCNATVFSGVQRKITIPPIPAPPPLENKIYVAMIISDGDNVQYMQHTMRMDWAKHERGRIPIGWTASPLAAALDPVMLDYYWATATTNDCLVSGPSGAGYAHINHWSSDNLAHFSKVSGPYLKSAGLRVITIWDKVNTRVANAFATNCPNLLGLTDQSGTYSGVNYGLRTIKLTPTYTSTVGEMVSWITNAAVDWNGTAPVFIAAQSDVWHLGPSGLVEAAAALDPAKYKLVRPDQLFMLANQAEAAGKK